MSVLETAASIQDQVLDVIKAGEDAVLSAVKTVADRVEPVTSRLPAPPFADQMVNPTEVIDQAFGFYGKLLANQKEFAIELAKVLAPGKATAPAKAKPAPKAAPKVA